MSDLDKSKEQLIEELASLRQKCAQLKSKQVALDAHSELFRTLVTTMETSTGKLMLRSLLQQTLLLARKLTNAEESSLFLLDADGVVTESVLARGATVRIQRQMLIGTVLDKGLAGWVIRQRKIGLITDTIHDERWLTLEGQPYQVRSVLGVPIIKGKSLLGIITLMHSQPGHFSSQSADLMRITAEQMALIIDNTLLYSERQEQEAKLEQTEEQLEQQEERVSLQEKLSLLGFYIIRTDGKFLYANSRLAEIFGYSLGGLVCLESILKLVAADSRKFFAQQLIECFQGKNLNISCTVKGLCQDGSVIDVVIHGTRTKFYGKHVVIGILS